MQYSVHGECYNPSGTRSFPTPYHHALHIYQDDCYATLNLATEEFATLDEVCTGFYVGNDVLILSQALSFNNHDYAMDTLEAFQQHR